MLLNDFKCFFNLKNSENTFTYVDGKVSRYLCNLYTTITQGQLVLIQHLLCDMKVPSFYILIYVVNRTTLWGSYYYYFCFMQELKQKGELICSWSENQYVEFCCLKIFDHTELNCSVYRFYRMWKIRRELDLVPTHSPIPLTAHNAGYVALNQKEKQKCQSLSCVQPFV